MKNRENHTQPPISMNGTPTRRIRRKEAAAHLGVSLSWLDKARGTGFGPPFIVLGSNVLYDTGDLEAFLKRNRRGSTSEQ